ncbi:hypothetical protein CEXT_540411 [Caerostris extrusa]|uniref:Uncharacterized protein n=1 Tax=Caerostris extrusa TaxID=172846 RepID=A0AAV4VNL2_CAEEX|nr:hypothetical protein CEXT_540411 [Caerostris extrusa]
MNRLLQHCNHAIAATSDHSDIKPKCHSNSSVIIKEKTEIWTKVVVQSLSFLRLDTTMSILISNYLFVLLSSRSVLRKGFQNSLVGNIRQKTILSVGAIFYLYFLNLPLLDG